MAEPLRIGPIGRSKTLRLLIVAVGLHACATRDGIGERLDAATGTTIFATGQPLVFARTDIRYSMSGRDYVYLGPVESNRQGLREYYIWVAFGSTLDRGFLAPEPIAPTELRIIADGELMEFELRPWSTIASSPAGASLYRTPVQAGAEFGARATLDQLEFIAAANDESLSIQGSAGAGLVFHRWPSDSDWDEFLRTRDR